MPLKHILITIFLALGFCVYAQTNTRSTIAIESFLISRDSTATVLGWFKMIEKKGLSLSYNSSDINLEDLVRIKRNTYSIDELLGKILYKYDFEYNCISGRKILLKINGLKGKRLTGYVQDNVTGEFLEGCIIKFLSDIGRINISMTDSHGKFNAELPGGNYVLEATYVGYESFKRKLFVNEDTVLEIKMFHSAIPLREVKVKTLPCMDDFNYKWASHLLSISDNDPFAEIHSLPGIYGTSVSGNFHVNGGQNDENLILLDGVSIYHSHHNNTLLAQFNGDIVKQISFFDSFIPAEYEGRLSSVTDVRIKEGDSLVHHQAVGLELPSASLSLDGPIIKNKVSYMISGRHSWIDFMKNLFSDHRNTSRTFKELTGKLNCRVNSKVSIDGLIYISRDQYNDSIGNFRELKILE